MSAINFIKEIAFNFKTEIPLKCFVSPFGDTLSPLGIVPFYTRNQFKIHLEQKKKFTKMLNSPLILSKKSL